MSIELVIATRNKKKVEEIRRILESLPVRLFTLDDFPGCPVCFPFRIDRSNVDSRRR